jgi:hypothetical protein
MVKRRNEALNECKVGWTWNMRPERSRYANTLAYGSVARNAIVSFANHVVLLR